eukprot:139298_1
MASLQRTDAKGCGGLKDRKLAKANLAQDLKKQSHRLGQMCASKNVEARECGAKGKNKLNLCCHDDGLACRYETSECRSCGSLTVPCISWYETNKGKHIHAEAFVIDALNKVPVLGATVVMEYQKDDITSFTVESSTYDGTGKSNAHDCNTPAPIRGGVTDWYCFMNVDPGTYHVEIKSVTKAGCGPWDGKTPFNQRVVE